MNFKTLKYTVFAVSALVAGIHLSACTDNSSSGTESNGGVSIEGNVSGVSQKGPFAKGSSVTLYELDKDLHQTGLHFETTIDNDSGKYIIKNVSINGPYAWMVVTGYFINEYTGEKSSRKITLNGLVKIAEGKEANINILNHLAFYRINNLVEQGISVVDAKKQAEEEVLKAFGFDKDETDFDRMNIFSNGEGDAKLLAISLITLYEQDETVYSNELPKIANGRCLDSYDCAIIFDLNEHVDDGGTVTDLMAQISYDLETDGTWENASLKKEIAERIGIAGNNGVFTKIKSNLKKMGASKIPDFEKYLKQFATSDTLWGACNKEKENEIREYGKSSALNGVRRICKNGQWKNYKGARPLGKDIVDTTGKYKSFKDKRDSHIYNTMDISMGKGKTATWMASLLEFDAPKTTKANKTENVAGVGRSYAMHQILGLSSSAKKATIDSILSSSEQIQGICPDGWHIPSTVEWNSLKEALDGDQTTKELLLFSQYVDEGVSVSFKDIRADEYYPKFSNSFAIGDDEEDRALNCNFFDECHRKRLDPSENCIYLDDCDEDYDELSSIRCVKD